MKEILGREDIGLREWISRGHSEEICRKGSAILSHRQVTVSSDRFGDIVQWDYTSRTHLEEIDQCSQKRLGPFRKVGFDLDTQLAFWNAAWGRQNVPGTMRRLGCTAGCVLLTCRL